ncbi:MAG: tetratricopeptide repeat protein [Candidatus Marinimicrobia bacterium]|nr:tetratricopeptide repeat protein [Candidatus Neomarinimicrobiota bacterium]
MKSCAKCGAENKDDSKFCSSCGNTFDATDQTKRFCSQCGSEVPLGADFCISCGAEVSPGREAIRPERAQAKAPKKRTAQLNPNRRRIGVMAFMIAIPLLSLLFYQIIIKPGSTIPKRPTTPSGMPVPRGNQSNGEDAMAPVMQKLDELNERIENDPDDFHAYLELGGMYATIGRYEEASEYFVEYLRIQPDDVRVRIALAEMYANAEEVEKAKSQLQTALKSDPDDEFALYNLGVILASMGDKEGARVQWQKVIDKNPDSDVGAAAKENLGNL